MLRIENIEGRFGGFSLGPISFILNEKESISIIGKNGAGKSSLLRIISGLSFPTKGNIYLDGQDITYLPPQKREIGILFQNPILYPHLTVKQNITFGRNKNKKGVEDIENLIEILDIKNILNRRINHLSGGERQRVALAMVLYIKPRVLLLDEPFASIHPRLRHELQDYILKIKESYSISVITVTHNRKEAMRMGDRIIVIDNGKIKFDGDKKDFQKLPLEW